MISRRLKLLSLRGVDISMDVLLVPLALLLSLVLAKTVFPFLVPELPAGTYWGMGFAALAGLLFSVACRELVLVLAAGRVRLELPRITVQVFGETTEASPLSSARREGLVAASGALANLVLGAGLLLLLFGTADAATPLAVSGVAFFLGAANVVLALFNLLPAFPLSGGRVLQALVFRRRGALGAARVAAGTGLLAGGVLVLIGAWTVHRGPVLAGIWLVLVGLLLAEAAGRHMRRKRPGGPD